MLETAPSGIVQSLNQKNTDDSSRRTNIGELKKWWSNSGWPDYVIYSPVFDAAFGSNLKLIIPGANDLTPDQIKNQLSNTALPEGLASALNTELEVSHCGVLPKNVIPKIAVAQRKRDLKLALAMQTGHAQGGDGTVLIAGSGHARKDRGVPYYLRHFKEESLTIIFREVSAGKTDPDTLIEPGEADYLWFTPRKKTG